MRKAVDHACGLNIACSLNIKESTHHATAAYPSKFGSTHDLGGNGLLAGIAAELGGGARALAGFLGSWG